MSGLMHARTPENPGRISIENSLLINVIVVSPTPPALPET